MFLAMSMFFVMISLISCSVSSLSWLFLTSISMMLLLLSSESFRVFAFESSMKLQEMSSLRMVRLIFKNSAKDSQNMWPKELEDKDKNSRLELLFCRSTHNLEPPLSSILFSLRFKYLSDLLTFRA